MKPIVLIHGYSAESKKTDAASISRIYGSLPRALRAAYGNGSVVEIDLSRYISLEDGITLDDVSRALDRELNTDKYTHLMRKGFHCIIHSTGALVIRNWLRWFSPEPSPLANLIYLAGANFGSGWAHIGKGQFAKWGRMLFQQNERGVRILHALELGSDWTIDLHRHFLESANSLPEKYGVFEHVVIGSQADVGWFAAPIRYVKEDGADGVVRVAAGNLNFNYVFFEATDEARALSWKAAKRQLEHDQERRTAGRKQLYEFKRPSRPGKYGRPEIPFAIPYECAHSGEKMGVVTGKSCREQVMELIDAGLTTTKANWSKRVEIFNDQTDWTYEQVAEHHDTTGLFGWMSEPRAQYDKHAQIVLRLRDQDDRPVEHYDVFFNSATGSGDEPLQIGKLIEAKHINKLNPNIICFYLRTDEIDPDTDTWHPRVPDVDGCFLEVSANEPQTQDILYLPLRYHFTKEQLIEFIQPHRTTIIDVQLLRVPSPNVFRIVKR